MREFAVSVLVNLRDRLSGGLNGIRRRLEGLRNLGSRLGLDRLGGALGRVVSQVGLVAAAFTTLATTGVGALMLLGNQLAERGGEIEAMARTAAVTTDALQELMYVGRGRGVEGDAIVDALKEMQLRADELIITGEGSAKEAYERLGLTADAIAAGLEEPDRMLEDILARLESFDPGAQVRILDEVFGGAGEQLQRLIGLSTEEIRALRQEAQDTGWVITEEQLAAMREYRNAIRGVTDRYTGLQNILAEKLLPVLTPLAERMAAWIDAARPQIIEAMEQAASALAEAIPVVIDGFQRMIDIAVPIADAAGTVIERLGGIETIAIGLATLFSVKLVAALGAFGVALLTTPIGWFVLAVGGAVALIRKEWDTFEPYFENLLGGVKALFEGDVTAILTIIDSLVAIVGQVVIEFGKWIAEVTGLDAAIEGAMRWLEDLGARFKEVATDAARAVDEGLSDVVTFMRELPAKAGAAIVAGAGALLEAGAALIQALWDGIKAKFDELLSWVATIPDRINAAIEGAMRWLEDLGARFKEVATDAARAVDEGLSDVVTFMRELPAKAGAAIVAGAGALLEAGSALIQALWDGIKAKFDELLSWVATIPDRINAAIGTLNPFGSAAAANPLEGAGSDFASEAERLGFPAPPQPTPATPAPEPVERDNRGRPMRRSSFDAPALTGARELASAAPASSGAAPRPERQEVAFAGELVVRVDGPGRVTSSQSSDPRVDIQPQRGPSLALA